MSYNLALQRGSSSFTAGAAKFGTLGLAGGVYSSSALSLLLASGASRPISAFTWDVWIKVPASATTGISVAVGELSNAANVGTGCWLGVNAKKPTFSVGGVNAVTVAGATDINDNNFHLLSGQWTGGANGTASLYVDGVLVATATGTNTTTGASGWGSNYFAVGGFGGSTVFDLSAKSILVDEMSFSNVAQYTANFTPPVAAYSDTRTGQVALYHFEGNATDAVVGPTITIPPNDANIRYSPFNWDVQVARAKTINPGAYLRAAIGGSVSSITAAFDMTNVTAAPQITYRVDNGPWTTATLAPTVTLALPLSNSWPTHVVEIVVKCNSFNDNRWATDASAVKFIGFVVQGGGAATRAIQPRGLNVLMFGDSITEGLYTLLYTSSSGYDPGQSDAQQGWAFAVRDNLGADVGVVGFGGQGFNAGYVDVPSFPNAYNLLFNAATAPARSFSSPVPDVIVINHGTNDGAMSSGAFQTAYRNMLNTLLAATPATTMIVAMRPFNGAHASDIVAAVAACNTPSRVYYVNTTGWHSTSDGAAGAGSGVHPYGYDNTENLTQRTVAAIRAALAARGPMFICTAPGVVRTLTPYRG